MSTAATHGARAGSPSARAPLVAVLVLMCAHALPLFFPPATSTVMPPPPDAALLARLFPGVPAWWVVLRLSCLGAAMALACMVVAPASAPAFEHGNASAAGDGSHRGSRPLQWAALVIALLGALVSFRAAELGPVAQLLYVASLGLPAALLAAGTARRSRAERAPAVGSRATTVVVIGVWVISRLALSLHSSRTADLVDGWDGLQCLEQAARDGFNVVTDGCYQGYTALPLVLQGAGILGRWLPLTLQSIQVVHVVWLAVCAAGVAALTSALVGAAAAPVAAAVFLFAPLVLMTPLWTAGPFVFCVLLIALLALAVRVERTSSPAAVAALGAVAGIAARCPPLVLVLPLLAARILWRWRGGARVPPIIVVTAALSFWAAWGPSAHVMLRLGDAVSGYTGGSGSWAVMEGAMFGRFSPQVAEEAIGAPTPHALDVPLGLLLAPFATPRTALRLWGDTILDPIGAALAALGLAVALRAIASRSEARLLVGVLVAVLLPGIVSTYDRASLSRITAVAVPLALLAASGFETVRAAFAPRRPAVVAAAIAAATIGIGGTVLFDVVNARILPRSALGIVLSEVGRRHDGGGAVVLAETAWKPRYTRPGAELVPRNPLRVEPPTALADVLAAAKTSVVFWSPGEEDDYGVSQTVCRAWPGGRLYELSDASAFTTVFAASRAPIGATQVVARDCPATLATEGLHVDLTLARASELGQAGRVDEATALVEEQARRTFGKAKIFDAAARALLAHPAGKDAVVRAVEWAARACRLTEGNDPLVCATLAEAHAANGQPEEAVQAARRAKEAALRRGDEALASELEQRIQRYARGASLG